MKDSSQKKLREKFIKLGVKMIGPETIFFSKDIFLDYPCPDL